ncbi:CRE-CLEC-114 protein [Caenorhabditis remanei]|uniref:CRE-CLEC-114 protein n=1 Tax=Caenorhabditis remanei TaxID=31234 RepID=E3MP48_CAERE|nr:CRE-CLEC-114 protein [Caenorhabditis remanei]
MVLIYGQPSDWKSHSNRTATIKDCMSYCVTLSTCVAVYVEKNAKICSVFHVGQIQKLKETLSTQGHKIAMKVEQTTTCAKSFNLNSMTGSVTTATSYLSYKIHQGTDGRWIFTTTQVLECPDNYRLFTRPKGLWCIGVISVNLCISGDDSGTKCAATGGVLSGLQTMEETNYIYGLGQAALKKDPTYNKFGYWVNGRRKSSCMPPAQRSASCNGVNEFTYTDPLLSAYDGYQFATNEPNGIVAQSTTSNCLNILFGKTVLFGVDDNGCTHPNEETELCYKGYVCGVKPSAPA